MTTSITHAMILCSGYGTRLRPLTDTTPKALVEVAGKPILDWLLDQLAQTAVEKVVVSTCHLAAQIVHHIKQARDRFPFEIIVIEEDVILETGGGILNALPHFDHQPFFVLNNDMLWESPTSPLILLQEAFNQDKMLALLGLSSSQNFDYYTGKGDYRFDADKKIHRRQTNHEICPYVFTGLRILRPELFTYAPISTKVFPIVPLFDKAQQDRKLDALIFNNVHFWDTGDLDSLERTQRHFAHIEAKKQAPLA